ncbi:L-aspartate oxidase [Microbacterium endophyticum]|uniref:L-aspartate oxidase n=1 Tax=Microbacterium endophyticum TaxID=1526412 RepID=A0A7W4V1G9_9MICO|nr:L-aspartate oxidase [Microbacterium endophyticum]MBB2974809.1 L-aspartate oxidase [Microbacterium endophyticum]NIK37106.1 L-aspartate oxidase [Microbacterium endophyticum]
MTSVIVVGSGIAGLVTALHAADRGLEVTVVTKDELSQANTRYAQGGIAAVSFADDSTESHIADTLTAGAGIADPEAVRVLVSEGPERIRELVQWGVEFDRDTSGEFVKGLEAAHSYPRVLHAGGDATGTAIEQALVARIAARGVRVIEHAFLEDLMLEHGAVVGVTLITDDATLSLRADAVVLATGGAGRLYAHTTNPSVATGDGIAAALRAGAAVTDMEFVQFHPTVLGVGEAFLVSEAVRGEGATLIDDNGYRFCFDSHPDGELAPRDVVARAIARKMSEQDGRPVRLDATALGGEFLATRFPTIDAAVHDRGLDWGKNPIPVTPAAHYLMGGISTDLDGRTSLAGLFAVGEAARTGVHGANRLASNSLLEGAVFAARTAAALPPSVMPTSGQLPHAPRTADAAPSADVAASFPTFSRAALQELMWNDAGLVRSAAGLEHAASVLAWWSSLDRTPTSVAAHEDENLLLVARAVVDAARRRPVSVGAHFRVDSATAQAAPSSREAVTC